MQRIMPIAVGSDIELFVQDRETKEIISAEGLVKGTKEEPYIFDGSSNFFATSLDNVLYEFCIPPARTAEEFYKNIQKSMNYITSTLPQKYCTVAQPSALLDEKWLRTDQARRFGCEGDFNAYTGWINQPPYSEDEALRSAGMHLHLSYMDAANFDLYEYTGDQTRCDIIKAFDLYLGVPAVLIEPENRRKELYGKAGSFRPKYYGVEYRTLSNYFVNDEGKIKWLYNNAMQSIAWLNADGPVDEKLATFVQHTINTNNKKQAEQIVKDFNLSVI